MTTTISVITPSFNQGRFIERTIQSVLQQDIPNLEYLVMDGGSTDETLSILKKYAGKVRWISAPDKGQADAVNKGIAETKGEIIAWLNSDDIYYPGALKKVAEFFAAHPDIDILYGKANCIDEKDRITQRYYIKPWNINKLKKICYICQPATFFRRSVVEKFGALDINLHYCLDYEYWLRLGLGGAKFYYLREILAASRFYPTTKTCGNPVVAHEEAIKMLQKYLGDVPDRWMISTAYARVKEEQGKNKKNKKNKISFLRFFGKVFVRSIQEARYWRKPMRNLTLLVTFPWVALATLYMRLKVKLW